VTNFAVLFRLHCTRKPERVVSIPWDGNVWDTLHCHCRIQVFRLFVKNSIKNFQSKQMMSWPIFEPSTSRRVTVGANSVGSGRYGVTRTNVYFSTCQLYTKCPTVYSVFNCIQSVQLYTECSTVYRVSNCIQSVQLYTECSTVYRASNCIQSAKLYTECSTVYRVFNSIQSVQLYTECSTVYRVFTVYTVLNSIQSVQLYTECSRVTFRIFTHFSSETTGSLQQKCRHSFI
jgi:hypothetical protein